MESSPGRAAARSKRAPAGRAGPAACVTPPQSAATMARSPAAAAALVYRSFGAPEAVLALEPLSQPRAPPAGHALVRWLASPVNWSDVNTVEVR